MPVSVAGTRVACKRTVQRWGSLACRGMSPGRRHRGCQLGVQVVAIYAESTPEVADGGSWGSSEGCGPVRPAQEKHIDGDHLEKGVPVMPGAGKAPSGLPSRGAGRGELRLAA